MKIRQATLEDLPDLTQLWQECMTIRIQSDSRIANAQPSLDSWLKAITEKITIPHKWCVLVARTEHGLAGYIVGDYSLSNIAVVEDLILDAHTYYAGVGRSLWAGLREWFTEQNVQRIVVRVPRFHAVEQAFWRTLGAVEWKDCPWETIPALMWMTF